MSDMTYQTDEYVSALEIETFLNCLQLEFMVKEHKAVREVIRSILVKNLPVPNRAIKVTPIEELPAPWFSLSKPKEFGFYIQYQTQQVNASEDSQTAPTWVGDHRWVGDHCICGFYNNGIREFVISVRFNKLNVDATDLNADNPKETVPMEEIVSRLKELGIDSSWINIFVEYASMNGFKASLPKPRLMAAKDKVYITFGDPDSAASAGFSKLKLDAWKPAIEWAIDERGGVFHIPRTKVNETENDTSGVQERIGDLSSPQSTQPKKEDKMASLPKTIDQLLKNVYWQRMQQAGLSNEAIAFVLGQVFHGSALKSPKEDSSFVIVAGKNDAAIYYSHDNKPVARAETENTKNTEEGEVIKYSTGIEDAVFVIDTSNMQEKLIQRHVGVPQLKLHFSDGNEVDVPFDLERKVVNERGALIRVSCNALFALRHKKPHNDAGPSIVDLTDEEKRQYFLDGVEHSEKEFRNRAATGPYTFMATE